MQTARRLYLYLLSGIGLGVLVAGVSLLLTTLFDAIGIDAGTVVAGEQAARERLTLATAMTAVALPVWLIHWLVAQRGVRLDRPGADEERSSSVRGLYFALAMGGLLLAMFLSLTSLIEGVGQRTAGGQHFGNPAGEVGLIVAAGVAWGYHLAARLDDWRRGIITGAAAWLPRTYLYGATFLGLLVLLFGTADLVALVARLFVNAPQDNLGGGGDPWWSLPLASGVSRVIVGGATWLGHVWYARRLWADPGERGAIERPARLRFAFYVAVLVVSAATAIGFLGQVGRLLIESAFGPSTVGAGGLVSDLLAALVSSALFAAAWWVHAGELRRAATEPGAATSVPRPHRLVAYPTALVGLAAGAGASAGLIGLALDLVLGGGQVIGGGTTSEQVFADIAPYALLGIGLWLWHWSEITRAVAADPAGEAASTIRRASLLIALAVAILGGVASLGVILYRLFGTLFGLDVPASVVSELSFPLGALLVTAAVAIYHGGLLRRDGALRDAHPTDEPATDAPAMARPEIALVLVGPDGLEPGTLAGVADGLRAELPDGFELRDERRMS